MNRASSAMDVEGRRQQAVLGDPARIAALERSGLLDSPPEESFDRLARLAARVLRTPVSMISLVTSDRQFVKSEYGLAEPWRTHRRMPIDRSICRHVVCSGRPLVSSDTRLDPLLASHPAIVDLAVSAYAGVPLNDLDGHPLGALCVISHEPREWATAEVELLGELAGLVVAEMAARLAQRADAFEGNARALEEAQALAHVGSWEWDPQTDALAVSNELRRLLGIGRFEPARGPFERLLAADVRADFCERVRHGLGPDGRWLAEHPLVLGDGVPRLMRSRGLARIDPDGGLALLQGTLQDITDERDQEARFAAAFWGAPIGSAVLGLVGGHRGRWLKANRELERILGAGPGQLDGSSVELRVHPEDLDTTFLQLDRLARGEAARAQHEHRLRRTDGTWVWVLATHTAIHPASGEPDYAIGHYLDIADRKRHEHGLERHAHHDPLTGIFNRRRFEEELGRTLSRAARSGACGALLAVELDGFAHLGDVAGPMAGDALLVRIAHGVGVMLRASDAFGRLGPDELAILLPEADAAQAGRVAERVLRAVGRTVAPEHPRGTPPVTTSIGITTWDGRRAVPLRQLLLEADTAMFAAKSSGGDQYAVYGQPVDEDVFESEF
jgi:diguanylate cyclase